MSVLLKTVIILLPLLVTLSINFGVRWLLLFEDISDLHRQKIQELTSHLDDDRTLENRIGLLSLEDVESYQKNGFFIYRNAIDEKVLEAMKISTMHVMENQNGLTKSANGSKFCGFSLHNDVLLDFWRNFMFKLPLSEIAADLMNTSQVVYSQDIIHATSVHCGDNSVGGAHSDQNQTPFSIEKKKNHGDNMVVAWIAIDELTNITMDLYEGTHKEYSENHNSWNPYEYCSEWKKILTNIEDEKYVTHKIELRPGDVALFQGLTFHRVKKTKGCRLDTCRRITVRYVDGEVTRWRNDIPPSIWPIIKMIAEPGELVNKSMAIVHDKNKPLNYNIFDSKEGPIVPSISDWFGFAWHVIQNGLNPGDIIFQCPETRAKDSKRKGLLPTLFKYLKLEY